jgi:uncharacterized membrane protein YesL
MKEKESDFTKLIRKKRFAPGAGITELPPEKGIRRFGFVLWTHMWKLVTLNLLFLAFSIPVVTIPAALCGMNRVIIKLWREGNCFLWSDFWAEFKANVFKGLPFGIICGLLLFASYYFLSLSISYGQSLGLFTAVIGFVLLGFAVLFGSYVFVFLSTLDSKNRHIARNAFILVVVEWKTNVLILVCVIGMAFIAVALFPYTIVLLVFIWISLCQLIVCSAVNSTLQRRIIGPYEQMQKEALQ